jgi:hypothetical protein
VPGVLIRDRKGSQTFETQSHRGGGLVKKAGREAGTKAMPPQAKEHLEPPEARRDKEFCPRTFP